MAAKFLSFSGTCGHSHTAARCGPRTSRVVYAARRHSLASPTLERHRSSFFSNGVCGLCATHSRPTSSCRAASVGRQALSPRAEISYVMIKPDGVQRGLVGDVVSRFERKGFTLKALKLYKPSRDLAEEHYKELSQKPFFKDLVDYIISGPVVCMVWEGDGVVASFRKLVGATNPLAAEPGTIRGDFGRVTGRNIVHASDSPENGERETGLWFGNDALVDWTPELTPWLVE